MHTSHTYGCVESMLCLSVHFKSQCSPFVFYHERVSVDCVHVHTSLTPFFCHRQFTVHSHKLCVCVHTAACARVAQ